MPYIFCLCPSVFIYPMSPHIPVPLYSCPSGPPVLHPCLHMSLPPIPLSPCPYPHMFYSHVPVPGIFTPCFLSPKSLSPISLSPISLFPISPISRPPAAPCPTCLPEPVEAPCGAVCEGAQTLGSLRDVGVATGNGSVDVVVVDVEQDHVEPLVGAGTLLLQVAHTQLHRLVRDSTCEQVHTLHVWRDKEGCNSVTQFKLWYMVLIVLYSSKHGLRTGRHPQCLS